MDVLDIAIRFGLYLTLTLAFGLATFGLLSLPGVERTLPLRPLLATSSVAGAVFSVAGLLIMAASMAGVPLGALNVATTEAVVTGMATGTAWISRMLGLSVLLTAAILTPRWPRPALSFAAFGSGIALATLAWNGHGAMDDGTIGWLHLGVDIIHLLAAGMWIGALVGLALLLFGRAAKTDRLHLEKTHRALHDFSATGSIVVALIVSTGLINAWLLVGFSGMTALASSLYGQLLLAKVGLFVAMLMLAAANRFRLTPALATAIAHDNHQAAIGALRRSLATETSIAVAVLAIVAVLGTLEPIASAG